MAADIPQLQRAIADAARQAFAEIRAAHPGEAFYAFALYTDDDVMTIAAAANSEEGLRRKLAERGETDPAEVALMRWNTAEWACEAAGDEHFDAPCELLRNLAGNLFGKGFARFKEQVHRAIVGALGDLEKEGLFGQGGERGRVTVFASIPGSDDAPALENESARALNPSEVYARFVRRHMPG
ncbi:MAG TPA: DUF4303 domain-containing protein [Planctomycetota bacterium]|nr:DUF4303 domain-containing protein [Planctomycetota bacterium]